MIIYFCLISNSYSADYEKGLAAARSGDFLKAIKDWKPLAEEGDASVQYSLARVYTRLGTTKIDDNSNLSLEEHALNWYLLAAEQGVRWLNMIWVLCIILEEEQFKIIQKQLSGTKRLL